MRPVRSNHSSQKAQTATTHLEVARHARRRVAHGHRQALALLLNLVETLLSLALTRSLTTVR